MAGDKAEIRIADCRPTSVQGERLPRHRVDEYSNDALVEQVLHMWAKAFISNRSVNTRHTRTHNAVTHGILYPHSYEQTGRVARSPQKMTNLTKKLNIRTTPQERTL